MSEKELAPLVNGTYMPNYAICSCGAWCSVVYEYYRESYGDKCYMCRRSLYKKDLRYHVEEKPSHGTICIWDKKQDDFKIVELYVSMFPSLAEAQTMANYFCTILNIGDDKQ